MKRKIRSVLLLISVVLLCCACSSDSQSIEVDPVIQARADVVEKWKTSEGEVGTTKYIEDIYKEYPDDEVISNIYYYATSKEMYDLYIDIDYEDYLETAIDYANNIDPNYSGELSGEIKAYTDELFALTDVESRETEYEKATSSTDTYNSLTNSDKKRICDYIDSRYDYYDSLEGGYSGDKYSDTIWAEAAEKYGLNESQISIIWANKYSY